MLIYPCTTLKAVAVRVLHRANAYRDKVADLDLTGDGGGGVEAQRAKGEESPGNF